LIQSLLQNMAAPNATSSLKQATLQTIGYICEEIPPEVLEIQANNILTAVVQGARKEEPR
jgi:importin subunit beta-1